MTMGDFREQPQIPATGLVVIGLDNLSVPVPCNENLIMSLKTNFGTLGNIRYHFW